MKETEDVIEVVYVRFDKSLDYKKIVNSFPIKKFLEAALGDFPNMVSTKAYTFDKDQLGVFIQDQYNLSTDYIVDERKIPEHISNGYYNTLCESGEPLTIQEWESDLLLDDHLVTINQGEKVLGVFSTENDFRHIIDEL